MEGEQKDNGELETTNFVDLGGIDYELADIKRILEIKHTTKDKIAYTLFCVNIFFTCFLVGYIPEYFYLWHTWKAVLLVTYRIYSYSKLHFQFFLLDFCYFTNLLILVYVWLPEVVSVPAHLRGALFTICFCFANGPVLSAIVLWKNSLVPHSNDKMTSLFIHVSPALTMWSIRWFSRVDQNFPLCYNYDPRHPASSCDESVDYMQMFLYPMFAYLCWQVIYIILVEVVGHKKVYHQHYATSFTYLSKKKTGFVKFFYVFGPSMAKPMFILCQFLFTFLLLAIAYYCYFNKYLNIAAVTVAMTSAAYNGASFYMDVFSHKYRSSIKSS